MGKPQNGGNIAIQAQDVTGQKMFEVPELPIDSTIGELIHSLLPGMNLPKNDGAGRPIEYAAHLKRETH